MTEQETETVKPSEATETGAATITTQAQTTTETVGKSAEAQLADMQEALKKANHEAAKYRKQVEAVEQAEKARKDADLSEMDKLKRDLAEAQQKAKTLEIASLQRQAAEKHGLPPALASRLKGETLEELEADASDLVKTLPKPQAQKLNPTNPGAEASQSGETVDERRKRLLG